MPTTLDVRDAPLDVRDAPVSAFDDLISVGLMLAAVAVWGVLIPLELATSLNLI